MVISGFLLDSPRCGTDSLLYNACGMRLDTSQQLRIEQQMKLSPRIIQAMEILQLPMLALQERIDAELQSNPVLEMQEADPDAPGPEPSEEEYSTDRGEEQMAIDESGKEDFERLADLEDEYGPDLLNTDAPARPVESADGRDRKMDAMANTPAPEECLYEYLMDQWMFVEMPPAVREAGRMVIHHLDEDGYLRTPLEEISAKAEPPIPIETLREAWRLVKTLEPCGVGAADLGECLRIQLLAEAATGRDISLEMEIVSRHLRDIESNRLPQIAKRMGKSIEQIKIAIENISHLNPRPGLLIGRRTAPIITPDVIVDLDEDGNVLVDMADGNVPRLFISPEYRRMAKDQRTDRPARQFLRNNIRSAQWLVGAIEQRRHTIRRVAEEVFAAQRDFLDQGAEALKPLPMADVAGKVGVHVATVSRAVAGKYAQTPRGIYPLRMFFSGGTTTASGEDVAWDAVKAKLKEVVDAEDKSKPLNDDQLAEELSKHGIDIARRTVAKYRGLLDIPPARKRRRY